MASMDPLVMNIVFFIVCAVGALFLIASICCLLKNCDFLRDDDEEDRNNEERLRPVRRKVLRKITRSLRRMTSRKTRALLYSMKRDKDPRCAICLEPLMASEESRSQKKKVIGLLNKCDHTFHFDCIWKWIETNSSCPICRTSMTVSTKNIHAISGTAMLTLLEKEGFDIRDLGKDSLPATPALTKASRQTSPVTGSGATDVTVDLHNAASPGEPSPSSTSAPTRSPSRGGQQQPRRHFSRRPPGQTVTDQSFWHDARPYVIHMPAGRVNVTTEYGPAYVIPTSANPAEYEWERVEGH